MHIVKGTIGGGVMAVLLLQAPASGPGNANLFPFRLVYVLMAYIRPVHIVVREGFVRLLVRRSVLVLSFLLGAAGSAPAQSLPPEVVAKIDAMVAAEQARQQIPGLAIAVGHEGTVVFSKGYGTANLELGVPVTTETAFRTASVAKPLTAAGVMTLVEAGKLDLDAPVRTYCPAWPETHPPITTRQLLGHLAGVRHYNKPGESTGKTHYFTIGETLTLFKNDPLLHAPGTKYAYTTFGYNVVGCAIEGASGQSYEQFMRDRVFAPAGMTRTRLDRVYEIVPGRAGGYQVLSQATYDQLPEAVRAFAVPGGVYNADLHDTSMKVPGGGLLSTPEDLVRFGMALDRGTLLMPVSVAAMWTGMTTASGEATGYGLGFGVRGPQNGMTQISHGGNQAGASSAFMIIPEADITWAIMTNLEDAEVGVISRELGNILRDALVRR